ncbi:urea carboxylase [Candidatus Symbiopectobacterium sp. NZEC151]|uniref:urea carboxylase n=2 Tax=unclassified Symbiopectobacterium TaxID=2794573 RepID=UPI0022275AC1|nr:urea carboxylase [Candidatus Symbiopectobacterium sp. NZEC151]MCW2476468.1 urea carboxylase [Candidatus Symbiopectobacterium sp. NZEC151]
MFNKVLIANRGAIACRIQRTLRELAVGNVAVYADADSASLHVQHADIAVLLGEGPATHTYLAVDKILRAARQSGAEAIHPGYGFLSENAAFAQACEREGFAFIGPTPEQLRLFGLKHTARALAKERGLPLLEGSALLADIDEALSAAQAVGYPVMLKSTAGGGGIGMRVCHGEAELRDAYDSVRRLGQNNFGDAGVFVEKYIARARHLEVQLFGDGCGDVLALGVRDCSVQRRNQKVLEETPAPHLPEGMEAELCAAAIRLAQAVNYRSAGTVEFVYDNDAQRFYFLEVNTRLQVEHGVTEQVWGVDLVRWMVQLAAGDLPPLATLARTLQPRGHAIQARLYAEDPGRDFQPCPGLLTAVAFPSTPDNALRIDTWIESGCEIPPYFDPMLAKVIGWGETRDAARATLDGALAQTTLYGVETNRGYLRQILADAPFASGNPWTRCLEGLAYQATTVEVLSAGTQTSVQDYPGRLGYWAVGIPPSGPMDDRALRLGNQLLGNATDAAALEVTMTGPALRFNCDAVAVVTGAALPVTLDGVEQPMHALLFIPAGATLTLGSIAGAGARSYLCLRGGIQVPDYLGSKSTFTLGQFGGHGGRALRGGDVLHLEALQDRSADARLSPDVLPDLAPVRTLRVIYGPHGAPEYFTPQDIDTFFATDWEVHFNSSRTGVRLIGPKPCWARDSGGEAGLHPSNIHDNPYAIGAVDFTGDMPVILGPDGPSLGGFVCPVTVIEADLWQIGQLKAGDKVRFVPVSVSTARALVQARTTALMQLQPEAIEWQPEPLASPIVLNQGEGAQRLVARLSGDTNLLLEFGEPELDLRLRFRGHVLMQRLQAAQIAGVIDLTPGIRSLQIHYQPERVSLSTLLTQVQQDWQQVLATQDLRVPSRIVYLPISWDDPACQTAIQKYMTTVRKDAPWCPSNLEFIRRINDLPDIDAVYDTVFKASYLVMGLGDVYLGAPVATPLDPRHRLVTTKYNPARTWTAENSVGIGGAYLCVYGMEGPGGYQLIGRTLQMWNRYRQIEAFHGKPWLLRFFDQIRFYPVSSEELAQIRRDFPLGRYPLRIEQHELVLADYQAFLEREHDSIEAFRLQQRAAFNAERERWIAAGLDHSETDDAVAHAPERQALLPGQTAVESPIAGNLWQVLVEAGQRIAAGEVLVVLESMKMEIPVKAPCDGVVRVLDVQPGSPVRAGQCLMVMEKE